MTGRYLALAVGISIAAVLIGYRLLRARTPPAPAPVQTAGQPAATLPAPTRPAATPPAATAPAPTTRPAIAPPAAPPPPTLPELARGTGTPAGDPGPVERALAERPRAELELGGELARAGLEAPPETSELFRRWQQGTPLPELRRFVMERFPRDLKLRALTLDWLERHPRR